MSAKVDLTRPIQSAMHPNGYWIHMYHDAPGIYFNDQLERVSNEDARLAKFDIRRNERERRLMEKRAELEAQAQREIDEELASLEEQLGAEAVEPFADERGLGNPENFVEAQGDGQEALEILKETSGESPRPRETNLAKMVWKGPTKMWEVVHKKTGQKIGEGLRAPAAEHLLLNTTR